MSRARTSSLLAWWALAAAAALSNPVPAPLTLCVSGGALLVFVLARLVNPPVLGERARLLLPLSLLLLFADAAGNLESWGRPQWSAMVGLSLVLSAWSVYEHRRADLKAPLADTGRAAIVLLVAASLSVLAALGLLHLRSTLPIPAGDVGLLLALAAALAAAWGQRGALERGGNWPRVLAIALAWITQAARVLFA